MMDETRFSFIYLLPFRFSSCDQSHARTVDIQCKQSRPVAETVKTNRWEIDF